MTPTFGGRSDAGATSTALRVATRLLQAVLLAIVAGTLAAGELGLAVNAAVMLAIALLPDAVRYRSGHHTNAVLAFLVALSPFMHAVGALGPYQNVPLFDSVAHAISAALVAGIGYVLVTVVDGQSDAIELPGDLRFAFVLIFAISFGVVWEITEFASGLLASVVGGEPLLAQYGVHDVAMDLLFNTIGATIVALWGTSYFDGVRGLVTRRVEDSRFW